jgi:hypothetical protein
MIFIIFVVFGLPVHRYTHFMIYTTVCGLCIEKALKVVISVIQPNYVQKHEFIQIYVKCTKTLKSETHTNYRLSTSSR